VPHAHLYDFLQPDLLWTDNRLVVLELPSR
jgi:hypothetical protein